MAKITVVQAATTQTSTFDGSSVAIDNTVFATVPNWTLCIEVQATGPDTFVRFNVSDSVNAFANSISGITFNCVGGVSVQAPVKFSARWEDYPDLRFGVASAVLRLSIARITGTSPSVTYQAWFEV